MIRIQCKTTRGFSFVELLITAAIVSLVFGGLLAGLQLAVKLISSSKATSGALALANQQIEYIQSLPYNSIGTQGGIPDGPLPQNATTTLNGITYTERILVQYVDSPEDGLGGADINGILADYKQVKVEFSWQSTNGTSSIFLLTNIVPSGIESTDGGGTLTVNVFDAAVQPVSGAEVHLYNDTTTSTIDITTFTNSNGVAMFAGAPAAANYQIAVTDTGYSTDQTYSATTSNPNPNPPHVAVIESAVSTMNFQIDELSELTVRTIGPSTNGVFQDVFDDLSQVASSSGVIVSGGALVLSGGAGSYTSVGSALSASTTPAVITSWGSASFVVSTPVATAAVVQIYAVTGTSTYTLVGDAVLPGNSAGFTASPIDVSALDPVTYPTLALGVTLNSSDPNETPQLDEWKLDYVITEPPVASIPFSLTGSKSVGTTASGSPVYKFQASYTTDSGGEAVLPDLEWDSYDLVLDTGSYNIAEACENIPYVLNPGVSETLKLTVMPSVARSIRVRVEDTSGNPIVGASVDISRSGFSDSDSTSSCGQIFFNSGLVSAADYQIDVSAAGYIDNTVTDVEITGNETLVVTLAT